MLLNRTTSTLTAVAAAAATTLLAAPAPTSRAATTINTSSVSYLMSVYQNNYRKANGRKPIVLTAQLNSVAYRWSRYQLATRTMRHNPNLATQVGYPFGENVAYARWGGRIPTVQQVASTMYLSWVRSAPHRSNMLSPMWRSFGIGTACAQTATSLICYATTNFH